MAEGNVYIDYMYICLSYVTLINKECYLQNGTQCVEYCDIHSFFEPFYESFAICYSRIICRWHKCFHWRNPIWGHYIHSLNKAVKYTIGLLTTKKSEINTKTIYEVL